MALMSMGQMSLGQMSWGQMSLGQMSLGQMSLGQMSLALEAQNLCHLSKTRGFQQFIAATYHSSKISLL
jgi:hypothetical protein